MTVADLQNLVAYLDEKTVKETKEYYNETTGNYEFKFVVNFDELMILISKYPVDDQPEKQTKIAYLCDRVPCGDRCSYSLCSRTTDITHARNFKQLSYDGCVENRYIEEGRG